MAEYTRGTPDEWERDDKVAPEPPFDSVETQTFGPLKETNPKDAIGVRKAPLSVVPLNVLAEIGVGMLEGAVKYGRHNYRPAGVRASVYFDAVMRHLFAYWEGQTLDPDTGLSHLTKAMTALVVWRDAQLQGKEQDDRPPASPEFYGTLNVLASDIISRHADKNPKHYTQRERDTPLPLED